MKLFFTAAVMLAFSVAALAQNITVKGTVKDEAGEPIVGANVILVGSNTVYALTDFSGAFTLSVPKNGSLDVSCLGYSTVVVPVEGKTTLEIVLPLDTTVLDETIVVAYGTATKSSFTGSAAVVDAESIEKKIATSVTSALAGTTPGVQVTSASGDPTGGTPTIRIRGIGSISASNTPLYIVDGVPYDGAISDINPQDVESMSVLKDAAASAIYGHRGANGVVIITTKKGKSGDATVKFDGRWGVNSRLIPQYDVIKDPGQYYETFYQRLYNKYYYSGHTVAESYAYANKYLLDEANGGLGYLVYTLPEGQNLVGTNFKLNPNAKLGYYDGTYYYTPDDWYKEAFHNAFRQEYNVSASGGSNRFNYYASVGFLQNSGIVNNSDYKRYTGRVNAEYQAKSWMRFSTSLNFSHSDSQNIGFTESTYGSSGNLFYITNNIGPIYPLYVRKMDENGKPYIVTENGRTLYDSNNTNQKRPSIVGNAVRDNEYDKNQSYADVLTGKFGVLLTPFKGFSLNANVGFTSDNTRSSSLGSQFAGSSGTDGYVGVSHYRMFTVNQQYLAEYKFDIVDAHHFDFLAGFEKYSLMEQRLSGSNYHLYNPFVGELSNADGTGSMVSNSSRTDRYVTQGFLGRIQYDYNGIYFLSGSYRRDSSSRFAEGHRWGNFGSAGVAYLMSKESWFNVPWVDMLKLKVSYGVQGNDNIGGYYPYADQYSHSWNEETGYSISLTYVGNEELTWETSHSLNVGVDFELFNNYLNGTVEFFSRKTTDLLYYKNVPLSSGNPTGEIPVNVGSMRNTGVELSLDGSIIRTKNVNWGWNLNLSHYTNKILELDPSVSDNGIRGSNFIRKVGGSIYEAYMYKFAGVDPQTGQAQYYGEFLKEDDSFVARPTQKQIDEEATYTKTTTNFAQASQYDLGSILPAVYGGFGTSLNAYGIDFSVQCSFQLGGKYYDGTYQSLMWTQDNAGNAWHKDILKAWQKPGDITDVPRNDGDIQVAQSALDRFLVSASYLSVNNVTLGYTFPQKWTRKIGIEGLRLYVAGDNLAVLTARKGIDPRFSMGLGSMTSGTGLNSGYYSAMRTITGGVTLTF
ncbi:MAG: TonB-dependent receptor [Bacteroidales bacterium]|nr:TonB-dependent receptor [Bacteroidales bacterium]